MSSIVAVADPTYGPGACHSCGASIVWAITEAGKRMPVDAVPTPGGNLELYTEYFPDGEPVDPGVHRVRTRPTDRPASSPGWISHFATCTDAPVWRRRPPRGITP